ncbi:hypothetical protein JZ751_006511 [Albula glossodonta]|uniref:PIK-related kinase FAT domain-containing protein n=1 Tax=Albula glossodonta TaxID=121402 RepID=A0A8T2N3J7_9TELE|nr:hypothetical protein JZ751_006511 [Albula glossodonta]
MGAEQQPRVITRPGLHESCSPSPVSGALLPRSFLLSFPGVETDASLRGLTLSVTASFRQGLEVIESTNLKYFTKEMTAEFYALKGMFLAQINNRRGLALEHFRPHANSLLTVPTVQSFCLSVVRMWAWGVRLRVPAVRAGWDSTADVFEFSRRHSHYSPRPPIHIIEIFKLSVLNTAKSKPLTALTATLGSERWALSAGL